MMSTVEIMPQISYDYANDLIRIAKGTMTEPVHLAAAVYPIPES